MELGRDELETQGRGRWSAAARLGLLSGLLTPPTVLLHELGHFAVPFALGRSATFHLTRVSGGALPSDPTWMHAAQSAGGPMVTLLMALLGVIIYRRTGKAWALALTIADVSRWLTSPIYLGMRAVLLGLGRPFNGNPNFDEFRLARILGLNGNAMAITVTLVLIGTMWLLLSAVPRGRRWLYFTAAALGVLTLNLAMHAAAGVVLARS